MYRTRIHQILKLNFLRMDVTKIINEAQLIKQGAEAKIYLGKYEGDKNIIIKERFIKTYRHSDLDKSLTRKRTKNEEKVLNKAASIGVKVPVVHKVNLEHGVIIMEYIENSILSRDYINDLVKNTDDESLVLTKLSELANGIGERIGILHRNEIIHGDLTTSNIILKKTSNSETLPNNETEKLTIYFIDFGLSFFSSQLEDKAVDLYVLERALISTHSKHSKHIFDEILKGYCKEYGRYSEKVIERLDQVRLRGRKRTMVG